MSTTRSTRRTDQIRERRASRARKVTLPKNKGTSKRSSSRKSRRTPLNLERSDPPVLVRGYVEPTLKKRKRSKTKRRYDVALNVPGAEIRLPSLPQVSVGWRLVSATIVALLGLLLYNLWTSPKFRVKAAEVGGLQRLTSQEVNSVLGVADESIFAVDPQQLKQELVKEFPEFSAVSVQVALPDTLSITVTERVPVLIWQQNGRAELVDEEGVAFPVRDERITALAGSGSLAGQVVTGQNAASQPATDVTKSLPVVEALNSPPLPANAITQPQQITADQVLATNPDYFMSPSMVRAVLSLAKQAPEDTPLVYDARHGLGWKDRRGWEVYFGDGQDMDMKLSVYKAIVMKLKEEEVQPALISVEYVHAPYYRLAR